ncbi:MAG: nucleotidyltransferase family protein [Bdellovibrionales bacterium]|nr:nucleotidyltransferase family protein [Bdellovibrionales bacterium]
MQQADLLILAAGFGKRLGALTENCPKALVKVAGKPLIFWNIELAVTAGFEKIFVNLHYLPELIRKEVGDGSRWGIEIKYSEEQPLILDTGGAIKNIESKLEHQMLVTMNCDTLLGRDFSISGLITRHQSCPEALATLVLRRDHRARDFGSVGVDTEGRVVSFLGKQYGKTPPIEELMYTGVQVLSRKLIAEMPPAGTVFSITQDTYVEKLSAGGYINSDLYPGAWNDVGTPERLEEAQQQASKW